MSSETCQKFGDTLRVGEVIKPQIAEFQMKDIVQRLYGLKIKTSKKLDSYDDINYYLAVKDEYNNPNLEELWTHGYVFKVINARDSQKPDYVEATHSLMMHLEESGMKTSKPVPSMTGQLMHLVEITVPADVPEVMKKREHIVCLFTFIPGQVLSQVPISAKLCYNVGKCCAKLHQTLKDFRHSFYDKHTSLWSLTELPKLADFIYVIQDDDDRDMIREILKTFNKEVIPVYNKLQRGMIHGDLNDLNILVRKVDKKLSDQAHDENEVEYDICSLIDFADATYSYLIFDVAIAICYMMIESTVVDRLDVGGHILAGYMSDMPISEDKLGVLKTCVEGRLCQSLVLGAYTYSLDPSNTYVLTSSTNGWICLRELWKTPKNELMSRWRNILDVYKPDSHIDNM